jgi:hypothetical protein
MGMVFIGEGGQVVRGLSKTYPTRCYTKPAPNPPLDGEG